jgi:hypothetical protein
MGEAPKLPDTYSDIAQDFVAQWYFQLYNYYRLLF